MRLFYSEKLLLVMSQCDCYLEKLKAVSLTGEYVFGTTR